MKTKLGILAFLLISVAFAMQSCTNSTNGQNEQIDSLRTALEAKQNDIDIANEFLELYNTSMDSLLMANDIIFATKENAPLTKTQIKLNLLAYNELLSAQKERVKELEQKLAKSNSNNANIQSLKAAIANMQKQLDEKDAEIQSLKEQLEAKDVSIAQLKSNISSMESTVSQYKEQNKQQEEKINAQTAQLNTAYVIMGSGKELRQQGILSGGWFNKKKINSTGLDTSKFTKIDTRTTTTIHIPSPKPRIVSQMPFDSYNIVKNADKSSTLTINDAARFWSQSSYLIIAY